jgi:colanic acid/amylovoran biosynthesis glycosyltransferase
MQSPTLMMIPSVPVQVKRDRYVFDRKFYDGIQVDLANWPGRLKLLMVASDTKPSQFDVVERHADELPFLLEVLAPKQTVAPRHLEGADIVVAAGDSHTSLHISALTRQMGIKSVYVIEYIPETRRQIVDLGTRNPVLRLRRYVFLWNTERKRRAAFRLADGLQCNGCPADLEYEHANKLLYFDTRVHDNDIPSATSFHERFEHLRQGQPMRLAFSGRLERQKGADHLVRFAAALRRLNVPFVLDIFGAGSLEGELRREIQAKHLTDLVRLRGSVDFQTELLPAMRQHVDLFVCLHRQSDPSCTYLETLSCAVPIVGYDNRAFEGLLKIAEIGWSAPMNDYDAVAKVVAELNRRREGIVTKSHAALAFARQHTFERVFESRMNQVRRTLGTSPIEKGNDGVLFERTL